MVFRWITRILVIDTEPTDSLHLALTLFRSRRDGILSRDRPCSQEAMGREEGCDRVGFVRVGDQASRSTSVV